MGDIRATLLDALAKKAVGPHSIIPNKLWHAAADEIERLRTERDTAFLEGVKAGLEAAYNAVSDGLEGSARRAEAIRRIDPTTIKEPSDG